MSRAKDPAIVQSSQEGIKKLVKVGTRTSLVVVGIALATLAATYASIRFWPEPAGISVTTPPGEQQTAQKAGTNNRCLGNYTAVEYTGFTVVNEERCQLRWMVESGCVIWYNSRHEELGKACAGDRITLAGQYALQNIGGPAVVSIIHCDPRARGNLLEVCA